MSMTLVSEVRVQGGRLLRQSHQSKACNGLMTFAIFLPAQAEKRGVPILYWLSGLTCNDENFSQKAGAFEEASKLGLAIVMPDTSPRDADVEGENAAFDLGTGAGFYLNASESPWSTAYNMYDYVTEELPTLIQNNFPVSEKSSIFGHSMGGHGALVCALREPGRYASVSAFAPISSPTQCPWGEKAFSTYLGKDQSSWNQWDANELVRKNRDSGISDQPILIDQGSADPFYEAQLKPHIFRKTCADLNYPLDYREQQGYDHSYYFISSFVKAHIQYHARNLGILSGH